MENNLTKIRGKHQLTITDLASRLGVTKQAVSLNEKGRCTVTMAQAVAECLNESAIEILGKDNFRLLPQTEEEKEYLINLIRSL